jgi:methylmalonyl-CoA mutase cobalamin-binding subunit
MEQCRGLIPVPDGHRRFVVGTDRDDRTHTIARVLRDDGNEVVLAQRDDTPSFAIDAVQEDADILVTATQDGDDQEAYRELADRLTEYGADNLYVAVEDPKSIEGLDDHVDAVYRQEDSLDDIIEDLYRSFDWQYLEQVGERTYEALEDWQEPRETEPEELETYLTEELGSTGSAAATKILNSNPALFES